MEVTRGFSVDPSLDVLQVPRCTCGKTIRYRELNSLLTPEYEERYNSALKKAFQAVRDKTEPSASDPLEMKFHGILRRYSGKRLEEEYERLLEKNPYERAFNELNYNVCCRATVLGPELVSNRRNFNPEIEAGKVDPFVRDEDIPLKYMGHMKRGQFKEPRPEGNRWYADSETEEGLTSYEGEKVVEWVEVPVPLFARNVLKKVNEKATSVILPVIPTTPDPWESRVNKSADLPDLYPEEVRYLAFLRAYPDFGEYADAYIWDNHQVDKERYIQAFSLETETISARRKKQIVRVLKEKGKSREQIFAHLRKELPDESEEVINSIIDYYKVSASDMNQYRQNAIKAYIEQEELTEADLESLQEVEEKVREEWEERLISERRARQSRKVWSNLSEFI